MALYERFVSRSRDHFYTLEDLMKNYRVHAEETFNFGYDVVDELAKEHPDQLALLWVWADNT
ncbi:MAG: acetyl-CoA synthetase, partial [Christensenellales bacterium]